MRKLSFKSWISLFECVDFPIGDLANDIKSDKTFPKENDREVILAYLKNRHANKEVIQTFIDAWDYYLKSR